MTECPTINHFNDSDRNPDGFGSQFVLMNEEMRHGIIRTGPEKKKFVLLDVRLIILIAGYERK